MEPMEKAIEAPNSIEIQEQYCCHCLGKKPLQEAVQAASDLDHQHNLDGSVCLVQNNGGSHLLQKNDLISRRSHGSFAKSKTRRAFSGSKSQRAFSGSKTHWTEEETEALLQAIEICNISDRNWSSRPNKWASVLHQMQEHGFCEKNTFTVQKKFQNLHWAFRKLKAWRLRKKLPLFENLSPQERLSRLLPRSHCPKLYARMEAFFASSGLDDGVNMVKDIHDGIRSKRTCTRTVCRRNRVDEDVNVDSDDDDDDPSYQNARACLPPINKLSSQLALGWRTATVNKSDGKHASKLSKKQPGSHDYIRGLLLTEDVDLEAAFRERNLHKDYVGADECCEDGLEHGNEKHHHMQIGYLESELAPECDDCNRAKDCSANDDSEGVNARDDSQGGVRQCAESDYEVNSCEKEYTKKQSKHHLKSGVAAPAVSAMKTRARKARKVQHADSCGEEAHVQTAIKDGKIDPIIVEQIARNNKQLSECIQGVIMSIQTVKLLLGKRQE